MATVYLARVLVVDTIHRPVAIKLMHPEVRVLPRAAEELIEETRLVGSIRHPNVVKVLDAGDSDGYLYLVFDYVEGETLAGLLAALRKQGRTLPLSIAGKIACDLMSGLQAAHQLTDGAGRSAQLIHRDVSPQNILVGVDGLARLGDFGIAKAVSRLSITATGIVKGKIGYMSPEQASGRPIDQRTDIWATGVVIWELLTGRRLFREKNDVATLTKIAAPEPAPSVRRFRPDVPPNLDAVVARALAKDVSERFESAAALRSAVIQAWTSSCKIAEADEVGEFVTQLIEPMLAERRAQVAQIIDQHRPSSSPAVAATPRPIRKKAILAAAFAAVTLPVGVWALTMRSSAESEKPKALTSSPTQMDESLPAPSASVTEPIAARTAITVTANLAMSSLRIDERAVAIDRARRELFVALEPAERDRPLRIMANSIDGRSAVAEVERAATEVELRFPELARARSRKSTRAGKPVVETVSGAQQIQLEPPPYKR